MTKPRIFINIHYLEIGGAESSLIGLLQTLDPRRVDVDLFVNEHRGEMMAYIPDWVNLLPECKPYTMIESPIKKAVKAGYLHLAAARLWAKMCHRFYILRKHSDDGSVIYDYVNKCMMPFLPSLKRYGQYDLAIACLPPYGIVLDKVLAKKKICWIHTDYTQLAVHHSLAMSVWRGYDAAICISDAVARTYCSVFPEMQDKVVCIENILSPDFIRRRADEDPQPKDMIKAENGYTLLTVGRYSYPKKLEEIPALCRRLISKGLVVRWYIIGYGGTDDYIRKAIADEGMQDFVVLLGKRENPYPYIKMCDWYVQPSRFEGKSVTVREAQVLGKPVIITAYPTSASQVINGVDGVIVPMDLDRCADGIAAALTDNVLEKNIADYLAVHDYGNEREAETLYSLISRSF